MSGWRSVRQYRCSGNTRQAKPKQELKDINIAVRESIGIQQISPKKEAPHLRGFLCATEC